MAATKRGTPKLSVEPIKTVPELERILTTASSGLVVSMRALKGDILILGVGGKVGPTLARLAKNAVEASGISRRVIGVDVFPGKDERRRLEDAGVETIKADLMAPGSFDALPDAENIVYMVGRKFGSTGAEWQTWMTNVHLAGLAGRRYAKSRMVAFSSGNIYPFLPIGSGGATESTPPSPVGEYAISCLGRERMFDYYANEAGAKVLHFRLNYAVELRYGVIVDVATKVWAGEPVDVTMGNANVVWQGYAGSVALQCFALAASPARVLNVTGPEIVSIRWLATRLGELMGKKPIIVGQESPTALLSNAAPCHKLFGYPEVSVEKAVEWVAYWTMSGGSTLNKPTHYETRDGKY